MDKKSFKPEIASVCKIQQFVKHYFEKQKSDINKTSDIDLIIEEIVVNVIKYGFKDISKGIIQVEINTLKDKIILVISDNGIPFNPLKAPLPDIKTSLEDRKIGGLGIFLARQKSREFDYLRENNQNKLTIMIGL
ncbi:MAG: ATP-binding protein [Proteobacteria bacterium]|nr:ATP-binding protein [Pseudomonadota bacterium]MBU1584013.1 ATP-binding protein [Pseudomonadota bacterium]MBU2630903.1 ATP-binding protein [Pseudomonadota bacterium]